MGLGAFICTLLASLALRGICPADAPPPSVDLAPPTRAEVVLRTLPGEPELPYYLYVPERGGQNAPLLVTVHGISRNAKAHAHAFGRLAARHSAVVVAPRFAPKVYRDYQRLGRTWMGPRSDRALERLIDHVGRLTGADTKSIFLFGYSGGAQFVHRFAMAHPEKIAAAVVSSPGWYTFPDPGRWYPYGIRQTRDLPGVRFDPTAFLKVPILVTVGELDIARSRSLRRSRFLDLQQGRTRLERAERWVDAMAEAAREHELPASVELAVLGDVHHSFSENVERAGLAEMAVAYLMLPERLARMRPPVEPVIANASPDIRSVSPPISVMGIPKPLSAPASVAIASP
jgi:pimeloyl-ACP methyl ester carboxylesterase